VRMGASQGMPVSLVPRTVSIGPNPKIFGNYLDGSPHGGTLPCAYVYLARFKSIDCRPLTIIRDCVINWPRYPVMMELDEYCCMN
jgi:hypothetical protein